MNPLERHVEIISAVLLAVATVGTAWSGYQSARWSGVQANGYSAANAARLESTRASTRAGQLTQVDIGLFTQWVDAYAAERTELAEFYRERFRDEFRPAFDAWIAMRPKTNPNAAKTPFALPEYRVAEQAKADQLETEANLQAEVARDANQRSDNYVLAVVLFASVLFFAGISTKFDSGRVKAGLIVLGAIVFIGTAIWVGSFPVSVSV
jgi:hypothetical protein